ncbi:hypothetical protein AAKU55_000241 [Oxalobacteraceae bacterium GrIS 1.11]
MEQDEECRPGTSTAVEKRHADFKMPKLTLVELDPTAIIEGERLEEGYACEDINTFGAMRETCPVCTGSHLDLVLRQTNVRTAHLFCKRCTRCFDARFADGSTALL